MDAYDVFLSYARADAARAALVRDKLEALGLTVFYDAEGIDSGEEFPVVIDRAVKSAKCVLGLWSRHALERRWVRIESRIGLDQKKLVAATLDATRPEDLPAEFYNVNFESLASFTGQDDHQGWVRVLRAIGKRTRRPDLVREEAPAAAPSSPTPAAAPAQGGQIKPWMIGVGLAAVGALLISLVPHNERPELAPTPALASTEPTAAMQPAAAQMAPDLTGVWVGEYWGPAAARTPFAMELRGANGAFQGRLEETNTFRPGAGDVLSALIAGQADASGAIAFDKTYDGSGGVNHVVSYRGQIDPSGRVVTGAWQVGSNAGEFRMERR